MVNKNLNIIKIKFSGKQFVKYLYILTLCMVLLTSLKGTILYSESDTLKAESLINKVKLLRSKQNFNEALKLLSDYYNKLNDDKEKGGILLHISYIKYLRGNSLNVYSEDIKKALQLNSSIKTDNDIKIEFKMIFWKIRKETINEDITPEETRKNIIPIFNKKEEPSLKINKNRLHFQYIYEDVSPNSENGIWETYYIMYYRYEKPTFNFFLHGGMVKRYGKNDYIGLLGFAKDWTSDFYTYSVAAKGTVCTYLPNARFDHDFNFKLGKKRNYLWTFGATYIRYYVPAEDFIISSGLTLFKDNWVYGYRIFNNHKFPGNIVSFTHLCSVEYGIDKSHWVTFSISWGSQAYLALYVLTPEEIRQSALNVNLKYSHWLKNNINLTAWAGYVKIKGQYDKYLLSLSIFFDF